MGTSLTRQLIESHRQPGTREAGGGWSISVDHVTFDASIGTLLLAAFGSLGAVRTRRDLALACVDRGGARLSFELTREFRLLADAARRHGILVARPGAGHCDNLYRERFAAPTKIVLAAGEGSPSCGALGMLQLPGGALDTAAVLAGAPLVLRRLDVVGVRLEGSLASWVSGQDLVLELARRAGARSGRRAVLEFVGRGTRALSIADRLAIASQNAALGMVAVVFPADETTRRFLKSQGREADWKACEAGEEVRFDADRLVDLNTIEPLIAPVEDLAGARAVRHAMGVAVRRVLIGSGASLADLARLARMMAGRGVHDGTELVVIPGSRQTLDTAAQNGVLQAITAGGARVLGAGLPSDPASAAGLNVTGLCYAARAEERTGRRTAWYVASLESCAAAALAGRIVDPREVDAEFRRDEEPETYALDHSHILGPLAATEPGAGGADSGGLRPLPAPVPLEGPLRGAVLLKLGDHVTTQHILPWGATTEPLIADVGSLAARAFARVDGDFVRRARAHGGGFAMAGRDLGSGDRAELAAIVVTALKVRAVLARSFDPQFRELLVHAGVLPLRLRTEHDWQGITAGDELEIPGLPETLEVGKPLVVRNLTRGTQHTLAHDLDGHGIALVRAGGVLRLGVPEPTGREEARR